MVGPKLAQRRDVTGIISCREKTSSNSPDDLQSLYAAVRFRPAPPTSSAEPYLKQPSRPSRPVLADHLQTGEERAKVDQRLAGRSGPPTRILGFLGFRSGGFCRTVSEIEKLIFWQRTITLSCSPFASVQRRLMLLCSRANRSASRMRNALGSVSVSFTYGPSQCCPSGNPTKAIKRSKLNAYGACALG